MRERGLARACARAQGSGTAACRLRALWRLGWRALHARVCALVSAQLRREKEDEERQMERDWYDQEEFGAATNEHQAEAAFVGDENFFQVWGDCCLRHLPWAMALQARGACQRPRRRAALVSTARFVCWHVCGAHTSFCVLRVLRVLCAQKRTADLTRRTRKDGKVMSLASSKRANELEKDLNAWEENRLLTSGVVRLKEVRVPGTLALTLVAAPGFAPTRSPPSSAVAGRPQRASARLCSIRVGAQVVVTRLDVTNVAWCRCWLGCARLSPFHPPQVDTDFDADDENRVLLLVHDTKPPFLEGKVVGTKGGDIVLPLKDPTSDMAVIARKGSALVKQVGAGVHAFVRALGHLFGHLGGAGAQLPGASDVSRRKGARAKACVCVRARRRSARRRTRARAGSASGTRPTARWRASRA